MLSHTSSCITIQERRRSSCSCELKSIDGSSARSLYFPLPGRRRSTYPQSHASGLKFKGTVLFALRSSFFLSFTLLTSGASSPSQDSIPNHLCSCVSYGITRASLLSYTNVIRLFNTIDTQARYTSLVMNVAFSSSD